MPFRTNIQYVSVSQIVIENLLCYYNIHQPLYTYFFRPLRHFKFKYNYTITIYKPFLIYKFTITSLQIGYNCENVQSESRQSVENLVKRNSDISSGNLSRYVGISLQLLYLLIKIEVWVSICKYSKIKFSELALTFVSFFTKQVYQFSNTVVIATQTKTNNIIDGTYCLLARLTVLAD